MDEQRPTHLDEEGSARMVDVGDKADSIRSATATGSIELPSEMMDALSAQGLNTKKGSITQTAIIAGTMAVKRTWDTIPLCHQIPIDSVKLEIEAEGSSFRIQCQVRCKGRTGVEMEALHGVSVAALTIYDMCKALGHGMEITDIRLEEKQGGKRDYVRTP
jgi:cyclic pyranopterin phosphate synthase